MATRSDEAAIIEEIGQQRLLQEKEKLEYMKRKGEEDRAMERWKEEKGLAVLP